MVIEIPFELDTIDALGEAETRDEKIIAVLSRVGPFFLHGLCAVLEFLSAIILRGKIEDKIVCTKYFEITDAGNLFLILNHFCLLPDLVFAILGPVSIFMIYNNPYTVFVNGTFALLNILNGVFYHIFAGLCGNPEQGLLFLVPIMSYLCGIFHIGLAVLAHMSFSYLDKEGEIYFGRFEDFMQTMKQKQ